MVHAIYSQIHHATPVVHIGLGRTKPTFPWRVLGALPSIIIWLLLFVTHFKCSHGQICRTSLQTIGLWDVLSFLLQLDRGHVNSTRHLATILIFLPNCAFTLNWFVGFFILVLNLIYFGIGNLICIILSLIIGNIYISRAFFARVRPCPRVALTPVRSFVF